MIIKQMAADHSQASSFGTLTKDGLFGLVMTITSTAHRITFTLNTAGSILVSVVDAVKKIKTSMPDDDQQDALIGAVSQPGEDHHTGKQADQPSNRQSQNLFSQ